MSKYDPLWNYISESKGNDLLLTYDEIEHIAGVPIDHSFLIYKKEVTALGWHVEKISMKNRTVRFEKDK